MSGCYSLRATKCRVQGLKVGARITSQDEAARYMSALDMLNNRKCVLYFTTHNKLQCCAIEKRRVEDMRCNAHERSHNKGTGAHTGQTA
jgi:hypothetical protein